MEIRTVAINQWKQQRIGKSEQGEKKALDRRRREVSLTEDEIVAINGLQFGIRNLKIERLREREKIYHSPHFSVKALYSATEDDDTEQFDRTENRTGTGTGTGVRAATDEGLCERGRGMIEG